MLIAFIKIHHEEPIQSLATKSDKLGKLFGAKLDNCYFNIQVMNG